MGQKCSHVCGFHRRQGSQQLTLVSESHITPKKQRRETETQVVTTNDTDEDSIVETEYPASPFPEDDRPRGLRPEFRPARKFHWFRPPATAALQQLIALCRANETDRACELLTSIEDVNHYSSPEDNPLILAIRHKNIEIVAALIDAGADLNPNCLPSNEMEAFHPMLEAVRVGDVDVVKCIHRAGGDLTLTVQGGKSMLDLADRRREDLWDYLQGAYDLEIGNKEIVALYKRKDDSGLRRKLYNWPHAHSPISALKTTPWMLACRKGWTDIMRRYYVTHRDVDRQDEFGMTGLMHATLTRKTEACRLLLQWGAKSFVRNKWGKTVLHFAGETGDTSLMELFGVPKEGFNHKTKMGETCYDSASHAAKALSVS